MSDSNQLQHLQSINREFEEREVESRARSMGIGFINLEKEHIAFDTLQVISKLDASKYGVLPYYKNGNRIHVGVLDPEDPNTKAYLEILRKKYIVEVALTSRTGFENKLSIYDSPLLQKKKEELSPLVAGKSSDLDTNFQKNIENFVSFREKIQSLSGHQAFNEIKTMALHLGVSDIHLEPFEKTIFLRFRIDGILYDIFEIPIEQAEKIILRIKYESGVKSNIKTVPQDGHIDYEYEGRKIHFRVSLIPTPFVESIVLRVLDPQKGKSDLAHLGFDDFLRQKIEKELIRTQGLVLVTGPTGSGKTTSLYALLQKLNVREKKLVTLEDPIEYRISGVSQSQIDPNENYTFETGFQSVLRHDPDVILVGEIRSRETARLACEASMTGHLVLSSLHTNSAIQSIGRLRNLGIDDFNIAPSLNMIIAQRLIRKIHPDRCINVELPLENERFRHAIDRLKQVFPQLTVPQTIRRDKESEDYPSPYEGRMAIAEILRVNDDVQELILQRKSTREIQKFLQEKTDYLTLFEYGVLKVLQGETTLEEVYRVAG